MWVHRPLIGVRICVLTTGDLRSAGNHRLRGHCMRLRLDWHRWHHWLWSLVWHLWPIGHHLFGWRRILMSNHSWHWVNGRFSSLMAHWMWGHLLLELLLRMRMRCWLWSEAVVLMRRVGRVCVLRYDRLLWLWKNSEFCAIRPNSVVIRRYVVHRSGSIVAILEVLTDIKRQLLFIWRHWARIAGRHHRRAVGSHRRHHWLRAISHLRIVLVIQMWCRMVVMVRMIGVLLLGLLVEQRRNRNVYGVLPVMVLSDHHVVWRTVNDVMFWKRWRHSVWPRLWRRIGFSERIGSGDHRSAQALTGHTVAPNDCIAFDVHYFRLSYVRRIDDGSRTDTTRLTLDQRQPLWRKSNEFAFNSEHFKWCETGMGSEAHLLGGQNQCGLCAQSLSAQISSAFSSFCWTFGRNLCKKQITISLVINSIVKKKTFSNQFVPNICKPNIFVT